MENLRQALEKHASDNYDVYSVAGWQPIGQEIVYGYERVFGFVRSAALCGLIEHEVKRLKRNKKLTRETFVEAYTSYILSEIEARKRGNA